MEELTSTLYFSDVFGVAPEQLKAFGAFDVSLINDLPLSIDPFLLFHSPRPEYRAQHEQLMRYLTFLRGKACDGALDEGELKAWFTFPEIRQSWLGYSLSGNDGRGLGMDFAVKLHGALKATGDIFGQAEITQGSHLEKIALMGRGIGKDNVSDFTANLIKEYLLDFTQRFARAHLAPSARRTVAVKKATFNYETETWVTRWYDLPFARGDFVVLTPLDLLTQDDVWINRGDMIGDFTTVIQSIDNDQLRAQLNNFFSKTLLALWERDEKAKADRKGPPKENRRQPSKKAAREPSPTKKQREEAAEEVIRSFPQVIDYFIRWKENTGKRAEVRADSHRLESETFFNAQARQFVAILREQTAFYSTPSRTLAETRERVGYLKDVIENKGGWKAFYRSGQPIGRESDPQIMFRLTWYNTLSDVNREVDNGRGPSDFEVSRGSGDKTIVELKLASNSGLAKNLRFQAEAYKKASNAQHAIKVILFYSAAERTKTLGILDRIGLAKSPDVVPIDARGDNKPSASRISVPEDV